MQISREQNDEVDALANLASAAEATNEQNASVIHLFHSALDQDKNEVIIYNLKKRLEESKGKWPEVLPGVLWAYRTTSKSSTGETLFSLVYAAETLILVEIGEPSTRYTQATDESNEEEMRINLDLLKERREAAQKQIIERYYNRKAHLRYFKIGDFVLKKNSNRQKRPMQES
uniref:Uncharacterized protein LOC104225598 n=1 Tax=Nicotiana sylvestris TaxID=4096 RepID=A0A1U7WNA1_NICSY|nr:PREDICTED: uncharacterized protein LOC104225598 [Nicotiana sylvestris]